MTPDRWVRVKTITADALDRPLTERGRFLAAACAGDDTMLAEVTSLLGAHDQAGAFLDAPGVGTTSAAEAVARAMEEATTPVPAGRRVGPYRILREIGRGGMGVVYLAARDDAAFEKQVAIKVVPGGLAGESVMHRFREERRILATLEHPNIARLLDGGTTDDGLPYLVMEYVDGIPLDVYAQEGALSMRDRLALFAMVCAAVQYAHQRLVIHRDLKARNILVTRDGTPKLLDFGIAKLLEPGLDADQQTRTGMRVLTLDAASPEQVRGEPLTVTSDVYALGVLLYRLLTGQSPYGPQRRSDAEMVRAICEEAPLRPSAAAPEADRSELRGELDWITLQALRKEAARRYESVTQLADDIQRHLDGRPVAAAPDSWRYRARKFAIRNRTLVTVSVVLAVSMAVGLTATLWQARRADAQRARAERRFTEVRKLATSLMGEMHDAIQALPGATAARALLLKRACEHLDELALEAPDDPALAAEVASAYRRLGTLQDGDAPSLGDAQASLASYRKALALRRMLAAQAPDDLAARSELVDALLDVAQGEDDSTRELAYAREAVEAATKLVAARPGDLRFRRQLANAHYVVGSDRRESGDDAGALPSLQAAAALYEAVYTADPSDMNANRALALCHKRLGAILVDRRSPGALDHLRKAVALDEGRLATNPDPRARRDLSVSVIQLGNGLQGDGDLPGALAQYRRGLVIREGLMRDDPKDANPPRDVALGLWWIGQAENAAGHWPAAEEALQRGLALPLSASPEVRAILLSSLGDAYDGARRSESALPLRREALSAFRSLMARDPDSVRSKNGVLGALQGLGTTLGHLGRWAEARAAYEEGLAVISAVPPQSLSEEATDTLDRVKAGLAEATARTAVRN